MTPARSRSTRLTWRRPRPARPIPPSRGDRAYAWPILLATLAPLAALCLVLAL